MRRVAPGLPLALALLAVLVAPGSARGPQSRLAVGAPQPQASRARLLMGTLFEITVEAPDTTRAAAAAEAACDEVARLEDVMSNWRETSELSRLNAAGFERRVPCSPDLYAVLDAALQVAGETDGAFDPTVEPLTRAWDLRGQGRVPTAAALAEARAAVGWRRVQLESSGHSARFSAPGVALDLGGIGKGYALDRAQDLLRQRGVHRAWINFGGQVLGLSPREAWRARIADPADRARGVVEVPLTNGSLSTSAQSEHGFDAGGVRYGHILDPRTGRPVATRASVTVVARSATRADALSTALLVMGRDRAAAWVAEHPDVGVLWLEPEAGVTRAWAWNLPAAAADPDARVQWMTGP